MLQFNSRCNSILPVVLKDAKVIRNGKCLVGPLNLTLGAEGMTIVMGPNGSGKTSMLRLMHGLERISAGTITWSGSEAEVRARQSFVFQTPIMLHRSVEENLIYPLTVHRKDKAKAKAFAHDWAARIGLGDRMAQSATRLSGGEKQKLALARALMSKPDLLFLDEPSANLDGRATREIEEILLEVRAGGGRIIMATHDIGQAKRLADDVMFMFQGQLIEQSIAEDFFEEPKTRQANAYLRGDIVE